MSVLSTVFATHSDTTSDTQDTSNSPVDSAPTPLTVNDTAGLVEEVVLEGANDGDAVEEDEGNNSDGPLPVALDGDNVSTDVSPLFLFR